MQRHDEACVIRRIWGLKTLSCSRRALTEGDGKAFVAGDGRLRGLEPLRAALTSSAMMSLFSSTPAGKRPADAVGGPAVLQMATWRFVRRARSGSSCCYCGPSAASRPAGRWPAAVSPASWHSAVAFFCQSIFMVFQFSTRCWHQIHQKMGGCGGCADARVDGALARHF